MKLVVGLGNPGKQYTGTRHNVGFEVIAELATRYGVSKPRSKFNAELAEVMMGTEKVVLVSPLTFMNLSGQSVQPFVDFYKLDCEDLMVVCDDMNLDVGRLRIRTKGSAGGQNGLKDIINRLGSPEFPRLRVGVGRPPPKWNASDFVLGKFDEVDRVSMDKTVKRAADAVEIWVKEGALKAMSQFNADPNKPKKPKPKKEVNSEDDSLVSDDDSNTKTDENNSAQQ